MRLRNLLAATAASALIVGAVGIPAHSVTAPPTANAGTVVAWGNEADPASGPAIVIPDIPSPVTSVAANARATGVVTLDGKVRVWGVSDAPEVTQAPSDITDAATIALTSNNGAVLHADGRVSTWGLDAALADTPTDLRAKAIALQGGTGYAVRTDGTLFTWGDPPAYPTPADLTNLVDISAGPRHLLALHANGDVVTWGDPGLPGLLSVSDFGGKKAVKIATGYTSSGAILEDGTIATWGSQTPANRPYFDGQTPAGKVVSLSLAPVGQTAAAVTADGAVHAWGSSTAVRNVPESLAGQPVSAVALGTQHAAVVVTSFRDLTKPTIGGTPVVGQTLTATPAPFSLTPDAPATGQWYADNDPIAGQTATTLTLDAPTVGKSITYRTTAARDGDTVVSTATPVGPVAKAASSVAVTASPASAAAGSRRTVTATVTSAGGTRTGSFRFTVGTRTATVPVAGGKATWTLPVLAVGRHNVTAAYRGDSATSASTSTVATLTVTKARSKVSGKVKVTGKTVKVAKRVTIALTVTSAKGVSHAGKVTLVLKGATKKTVVAKVNAAGKAVVTIKNVKRGKYAAQLTYAGNSNISGAKGSVKFKL